MFFLVSCNSDKESFNELYEIGLNEDHSPEVYQDNDGEDKYILVTPQGSGQTYSRSGWGELNQVLDIFNGTIDCQDCSSSSGYIITRDILDRDRRDLNLTSFCQGNLIDEDVFLVNRHCVPRTISSPGDSCENEIQVVLPRLDEDNLMEVLQCDEMITVPLTAFADLSDDNFQINSWVALKLKDGSPGRFSDSQSN